MPKLRLIDSPIPLSWMTHIMGGVPVFAWLNRWADGKTVELCVGTKPDGDRSIRIALTCDEAAIVACQLAPLAEPSPLLIAAETLLAVIGDYEGEGAQADAKVAVVALRAAVDAARGRTPWRP